MSGHFGNLTSIEPPPPLIRIIFQTKGLWFSVFCKILIPDDLFLKDIWNLISCDILSPVDC